MDRAHLIASHVAAAAPSATLSPAATSARSADDIVIVNPIRTAIGRAKRGSFKDTPADELLKPVLAKLRSVVEAHGLPATAVGDIVIGTVLPRGGKGATEVRIASLLAGFPEEVPCTTVNRQCSSGLQAIANVAGAISAGFYEMGIAGGVETMSMNDMSWEGGVNMNAVSHPSAKGCYMNMGQTSEAVAERFNISRDVQDRFAARSHALAAAAQEAGKFVDEILPIEVEVEDKEGNKHKKTVSQDEGIRKGTTVEKLAKLRTVFQADGSTTAGNASQLSDGSSATLVMRRSFAEKHGFKIMGTLRSFAAVGVEPAIMGIGPAAAIPAALEQAGISSADVGVFEINEAFASQATYCVAKLGINPDLVNPNGGAIALGHPLGCTGARMTSTLLHEMKRRGSRYGIVSMCIGSGMGAAAVYELEH
eukprot:TRINITY_DN4538_c0_g1_i2.p1 TRINITY_DN4538_c0_g1~~TRINITY_DN4538_c0_g1_i2.p1  ORF type:complete len:432 (-),score=141.03 TRINITY_DN4538_c0_g1_i2:113-1378(-)